MKIKKRKIFKFLLMLILIIGLAFLVYFIFNKSQEGKFKKILKNNDCYNYKLTEIVNEEETNVIVRDNTLLSENGDVKIWMSEEENKRVIFDEKYKTAVLDENDENLEVNSLNYTFINDYFENSRQKFKYGGKKDGHYKLEFKEKGSGKITILYLNEKTNIIDKLVQNAGNFEMVTEFKVEKNKVTKEEIAFPNLEGYRASDSVNSRNYTEKNIGEKEK